MLLRFLVLLTALCFVTSNSEAGNDPGKLSEKYNRIRSAAHKYGPNGIKILALAYEAIKNSKNERAGLEDLWTAALKEGRTLFQNSTPWMATYPSRTRDMLGQISIGPWQITVRTARKFLPKAQGTDLSDLELIALLENHPDTQASIAAKILETSYETYGTRTPFGIQNYFWLDAFQRKEIGQGPWYASVLAADPHARARTGFYAKQFLLGSRFNPQGLLYWLYITKDHTAVRETIDAWKIAGYPIRREDLAHCSCPSDFQKYLRRHLVLK